MKRDKAKSFIISSLEPRVLLAWSGYAQLVGQDDAASEYGAYTGAGQTIAVVDTGIDYNHASLGGGFGAGHKVIAGYDFLDNDSDPMDEDGHGTEVAGMIAAERFTYQGTTYQGIAPDANLVALRVGNETGIQDANIEKALQWIIDHHEQYDISVVNLSLGSGAHRTSYTNSTLSNEFQQLADLNISVFAASGNSGRSSLSGNGVSYPGADANVISVGSITANDSVAEYTQRGSLLDLLAPGDDVVSTKSGGGFEVTSGTSFSSPLVAGIAALVRQAANWLTENEVASILRTSGTTNFDGDNETGRISLRDYSRVNVRDAIKQTLQLTTRMLKSLDVNKSGAIDSGYDVDGVLHVAYYDPESGSVRYATQLSNGKWSRPLTASDSGADAGQYLSLAFDQAGKPAVAYYDATNKDLRLATFDHGSFSTVAIDTSGDVGKFVSLAFDSSGDALISYYDATNGDLKFAGGDRRSGYSTSIVDSTGDVGQSTSIAASDSTSGTIVAVAYADQTNGNLKYSRFTSTSSGNSAWTTFVVDDIEGVANVDLSLHGGRAAIAYRDTDKADVKYAYRNTDWFTETVASKGALGLSVDLYYASDDVLHVTYYNRTKDATYDASRSTSGIWSNTRIGPGGKIITVADFVGAGVVDQVTRLVLDRPRLTIRPLDDNET